MASRLTRWTVVTLLGFGGALAVLLPPGVSPLATYYFPIPPSTTDPLTERVAVMKGAYDRATFQLNHAVHARRLAAMVPRGNAPVVVTDLKDTLRVDPARTRVADSIWRGVPRHPQAPPTLLVASLFGRLGGSTPAPTDYCTGFLLLRWGVHSRPLAAVESGAGACLLATEFGPPGHGLDAWLRAAGTFYIPGKAPRVPDTIPLLVPTNDVWFPGFDEPVDRMRWWAPPVMRACSAGRAQFCPEALGFGPTGLDSIERWPRAAMTADLLSAIPATLLDELGPERFTTLWRSNDPLPVTYARVTGRSFDRWALDFLQHRVGRVVMDNAMSWSGWAGWALWMVLLFAWFAVRLRDQPAQ